MSYNKLRNLVEGLDLQVASIESRQDALDSNISGALAGVNDVVLVKDSGVTNYDSISAAVAASVSGDFISVGPGVWDETFVIPPGVILGGSTAPRDIVIRGEGGAVHTGSIVTLSDGSAIRDCSIQTPTDGAPGVKYTGSANAIVTNMIFNGRGSGWCLEMDGTGQLLGLSNGYLGGDCGKFAQVTSGDFSFSILNIVTGSFAKLFDYETDGKALLQNVVVFPEVSASIGNHIRGDGLNLTQVNTIYSGSCGTGLQISAESGTIYFNSFDIESDNFDIMVDGDVSGIGTELTLDAGEFRYERLSFPLAFPQNAVINATFTDRGLENDQAFRVISEFNVGSPDLPKESAFGEGDSNVFGMRAFSSGSSGFTDVTAEAKSRVGSTFTALGGTASGSAFYIGSEQPRQFTSLRTVVETALTGNFRSGIWEFWNGSGWESVKSMMTDAGSPYRTYDLRTFTEAGSYQIRFDNEMTGSWETTTVNGVSGYWMRFGLTGSITTAPVLERMKLGTNRTEINEDGFREYFGTAEPKLSLFWAKGLEDPLDGATPADASITFSSNITIAETGNRFANNTRDGRAAVIAIPVGFDTSRPLEFNILWYADSNGSPSTVELEMDVVQVKVGGTLGSLPEQSLSVIETVGTSDAGVLKRTRFFIDVSRLDAGEFIAFSYFRDASGGNADDTLAGNVIISTTEFSGYFWR